MAKTYLFWEPLSDNILQERDESGTLVAEYTAESGLYGSVIGQNRGGVKSQFHFDIFGSTVAVSDHEQQITDTRAYSAFGESTESTGTTVLPFQYIGQKGYRRDSVTGNYATRPRSYAPALSRWQSVCAEAATVECAHSYVYAKNRIPMSRAPSGAAVGQDQFPAPGSTTHPQWICTAEESACIQTAVDLALATIRGKAALCFRDLVLCPDGKRSICTPDVLSECLQRTLANTKYACVERGTAGCHVGAMNPAHTDSVCALLKSLSAAGPSIPGIINCEPCRFPLPFANDCSACPQPFLYFTFTSLCRDRSPNRRSIASYCSNAESKKQLATSLVHEAAHSCVGGHGTTGKKDRMGEPSCDKCNRNDSFDIDLGFSKCLA